jgi:predicted metal-dependent hydrolase
MLFKARPAKPPGSKVEPLDAPFPLPIPLELKRSRRARRITLRVDSARGRAILTAPHSAPRRQLMDFLVRHEGWLKARIAQLPLPCPFVDGATVPVLGIPHRVRGDSSRLRGLVSCSEGVILVPGAAEHLPRRLSDFLKKEARREIESRALAKSAQLGRPITALALRDTRSRWGSCSAGGRLALSWRLILAPEFVLDYVVAHEVAHLAEMNHGVRFWRLCAQLTDSDPKAARAWLRQHGAGLHSYG